MTFTRYSGNVLTTTLLGMLGGYLYSLILMLTSTRFLHYLPVLSTLRSFFFAFLFGSFTGVVTIIARRTDWKILFSPVIFMITHFLLWCNITVVPNSTILMSLAVGGLGVLILGIFIFIPFMSIEQYSPKSATVITLSIIILFAGHFFLLRMLPVSKVDERLRYSSERTLYNPITSTAGLLDPFSLPLEDSLRVYPMLLPEVPNGKKILVLVLDAFREDFFGKNLGGTQLTPYMQELAQKNFYFSNYRIQVPWTKGSTASLFTGQYARRHGTFLGGGGTTDDGDTGEINDQTNKADLTDQYWGHALPQEKFTLAERLKREGYSSLGLVEIEHISSQYQFDQGFNDYFSYSGAFRNHPSYLTRRLLFWFLKTQPTKSFIYIHLKGPHYPYPLSNKNSRFWQRTNYYQDGSTKFPEWDLPSRNILELVQDKLPPDFDQNIVEERKFLKHLYGGELNTYDRFVVPRYEALLRELELWNQTNYIITSDHGEGIYDHGRYFGHGLHLYEEAIHVPLILKPSRDLTIKKNGGRSIQPDVESVDLTATLLDLAGASREKVSGQSFLPAMKSNKNYPENPAYSEKTLLKSVGKVALINTPWKYIYNFREESGYLYDLSEDPNERNPVDNHSDRKGSYQKRIREKWPAGGTIPLRAPLRKIGPQGREKLKGLGYLQ